MSESKSKNNNYNSGKIPASSVIQSSLLKAKKADSDSLLQVNCCKNFDCKNYNIPIETPENDKRFRACGNDYMLQKENKIPSRIRFKCLKCNEWSSLYDNQSIYNEYLGISGYFDKLKRTTHCKNVECINYALDIRDNPDEYVKNGKTAKGMTKYRCKSCKKGFTEVDNKSKTTKHQTKHHKNRMIFKLLMSQVSLRGIIDATEIGSSTIYAKINFFYDQCRKFSQAKEKKIQSTNFKSLKISSDHQFYQTNWRAKGDDEFNVQLYNLSSTDNDSGYVFISSLNFDPQVISEEINKHALAIGDLNKCIPHRHYARYILNDDYGNDKDLQKESPIKAIFRNKPTKGMQVYKTYTMFAHFLHLRELLGKTKYLTLYNDYDSALKSVIAPIFASRVKNNTLEAYALGFSYHAKGESRKKKELKAKQIKEQFEVAQSQDPEFKYLSEFDAKCKMVEINFNNPVIIDKKKWHYHPTPGAEEEGKRIWWITERQSVGIEDVSGDIITASNKGVDRFFQTCRRKLSFFERTNKKVGNQKDKQKNWSQYGAYDPAILVKLLEIMRVYYNFVKRKDVKITPAQKLGIVKKAYDINDILYFK